jgi:hypothetical protein
MRDMLDTLTRGPFRDDTHRAAVEAAAEDLGRGQLFQNSKQFSKAPAEPVGGEIKAYARATRVEAEDGRVRAAQNDAEDASFPVIAGLDNRLWDSAVGMAMMTLNGEWGGNPFAAIEAIWAASEAVMDAAGPLPLVSGEPWVEDDHSYRCRLFLAATRAKFCNDAYTAELALQRGYRLDNAGVILEMPRGRLVHAITMQGEQHD